MKINASDRKKFLNLAYALAKDVVTKNEYFDILTKLKEVCTTNSRMKWLKFQHERREHFVPAYRGFFLLSMNIAESGQSGVRAQQPHGKMLSLVCRIAELLFTFYRTIRLFDWTRLLLLVRAGTTSNFTSRLVGCTTSLD